MFVVSLLCGLGAGGCVLGQPVEPLFATVGSSYLCGRVQFIITSATTVTPDWPDRPCSGNPPLAILDAGTMGWDEANGRTLTMPLRIVNRGTEPVQLPIRLILAVNGKTVLNPFETPNSTMVPLNADSTRATGTKVWLVGGSGTVGPGDSTAVTTVLFQINSPVIQGRFAFTISGETVDMVPAKPPDTVPSWFSDDSSYTNGGRGFLRGVIGISFKLGTTPAQKLAAVSLVGGTVIGGRAGDPGWDGAYYLRILDDGTGTQLKAAVDTLIARPEILVAALIHPIVPFYRRPTDGNNWKPVNWNLAADTAIGENWALEAIRAPLAWGCETGTTLPRMWVADRGFDSLPDLAPNILQPPLGGFFRAPSDNLGHGTRVTSVIAAVGNNQLGMAGVMWTAALRLRTVDRITDFLEVTRTLRGVALAGADILNISGGRRFDTTLTAQANSQIGQKFASDIAAGLGSLGSSSQMPLLVVAAGDDNADADVAGIPGLKAHLPGKVLVVAAAQTPSAGQQRPWTGVTNGGALVDVYAPGLGVAQLDIAGGIDILQHGSSFSAALVTGIAGLLKAFDPSLTPSQLRDRVVEGSQGANRNGVVDAYASLLLAAERPSAPLCGNRVWTEGLNLIKVRRGNTVQLLYTSPDTIGVLLLHHGGRRIHFQTSGSAGIHRSLDYAAGGWVFSPGTSTFPDSLSGTTWSLFRRTHDADSASGPPHFNFYGAFTSRPTGSFTITLGTSASSGRSLYSDQRLLVLPGNFISTRRDAEVDTTTGAFLGYVEQTGPQFQSPTNMYQQMNIVPVPSPLNDRVYFAINTYNSPVTSITQWAPGANATPIGNEWSYQERQVHRNYLSHETELWSVPWAGGTAQMHWGRGGKTITWFGLAEFAGAAGHEAVMAIGTIDAVAAQSFVGGFVQCNIEYMLIAQQTPTEAPRSAPPTTCDIGGIETAQIAPRMVGPRGFQSGLPLIPGLR
jgi:hypothetical protein